MLRAHNASKITKNYSQGIIFVMMSCQRVHLPFLPRYFRKSMPSPWQKVVCTPPIRITIQLPLVSRYFCRSIRVRGRWNTPNQCLSVNMLDATLWQKNMTYENNLNWEPLKQSPKWKGGYYGPKWIHTHSYDLGENFSIAQDICYTGLSDRNSFV